MDQDGDGVNGETADDLYVARFTILPNGGLSFDGGDRVTIPSTTSLNPAQITVELWAKFGRLAYGGGYSGTDAQMLLCKGGDRTSGAYRIQQGGTGPGAYYLAFAIGDFSQNWMASASLPLETGRWYHIAGTYDSQTLRLYLDGTEVASKSVGAITVGNSSPLYLSYDNVSGYPYYFTGSLADVPPWNSSHSGLQIDADMLTPVSGTEQGLAGTWSFDEATGSQSVLDRSPNANHGYLGTSTAAESDDPTRSGSRTVRLDGTSSDDTWYIRHLPDSSLVQVFQNTPLTGHPRYCLDASFMPPLIISGGAGSDTITIDASQGYPIGPGGLSVEGGPDSTSLLLLGGASTLHLGLLSVADGGTLSFSGDNSKALVVESLGISGTGRLDLADNDMILHNASLLDVQALITGGQLWSSAAAETDGLKGLALANGQAYRDGHFDNPVFHGHVVVPTDVVVKYTYRGDANLDGQISLDDYLAIDSGFRFGGMVYTQGNFDYSIDGITYADYALIDQSFHDQGSPQAPSIITLHSRQFGAAYMAALTPQSPATPTPVPPLCRSIRSQSPRPLQRPSDSPSSALSHPSQPPPLVRSYRPEYSRYPPSRCQQS